MSNLEKIILSVTGILTVIVLVLGVMLFRLQKDVTILKNVSTAGASGKISSQNTKKMNGAPPAGVLQQFMGVITNTSGNQLTADIKLPDFSKSKKSKGSEGGDYEIIDKNITVNSNEKTVFEKKALADLKAGDSIFVFSHNSPYTSDTVTAEKIIYIEKSK
jgi:hypothetical protein